MMILPEIIGGAINFLKNFQKNFRFYLTQEDLPLLDTREKKVGDLTGTLISDIVLQLFSYVAETERLMNHQRTMEGLAAAKAKGAQFGRPPLKKPANFEAIRKEWKKGKISETKAAKKLNISRPTFHKWTHE